MDPTDQFQKLLVSLAPHERADVLVRLDLGSIRQRVALGWSAMLPTLPNQSPVLRMALWLLTNGEPQRGGHLVVAHPGGAESIASRLGISVRSARSALAWLRDCSLVQPSPSGEGWLRVYGWPEDVPKPDAQGRFNYGPDEPERGTRTSTGADRAAPECHPVQTARHQNVTPCRGARHQNVKKPEQSTESDTLVPRPSGLVGLVGELNPTNQPPTPTAQSAPGSPVRVALAACGVNPPALDELAAVLPDADAAWVRDTHASLANVRNREGVLVHRCRQRVGQNQASAELAQALAAAGEHKRQAALADAHDRHDQQAAAADLLAAERRAIIRDLDALAPDRLAELQADAAASAPTPDTRRRWADVDWRQVAPLRHAMHDLAHATGTQAQGVPVA